MPNILCVKLKVGAMILSGIPGGKLRKNGGDLVRDLLKYHSGGL